MADADAIDALLVDRFLEAYATPPEEIILDVDATDDPGHGHQEGRFFPGYYRQDGYWPLYIFCDEHRLCARLRPADQDGAGGTTEALARISAPVRRRGPQTRMIVRGESGFCRDALMSWCEAHGVDYVWGLAKNSRRRTAIAAELAQAKEESETTQQAARVFRDFRYQTHTRWACARRVIGKAEHLAKGETPRVVVTSLSATTHETRALYEALYWARGDMENRIKAPPLGRLADRTSTREMLANQLRLSCSSFASGRMPTLRRVGLNGTSMANAQCDTIRVKLFKIGAQIRISVRRI